MNDEVVGKIKTFSSIATNFESANVLVDNFPVSVKVPKGSQNARINKAVGGGGSFFFSVYNLSHYSNAKFDFWFCVNNTETYNDLFPQRNIFEKELILPLCGFFWGFENKTNKIILTEISDTQKKTSFEVKFRHKIDYKHLMFVVLRAIVFIEHHSSTELEMYEIDESE